MAITMGDYEKLGVFYLGRELAENDADPAPLLLYDSKDLVTHAVCVGMTGSGKTGLCVALLEEAAIDGVPAIVIDPKGDLANLLLTFPELASADFLPWINEDDARRKDSTPEAYAEQQAAFWKQGLAGWGQDGARIARLRASSGFDVYTPGSNAGIPVSLLGSFAAPPKAILEDADLFRERVDTTATSLLSLFGIDADPLQSREHVLICAILESLWARGVSPGIADLIRAVVEPPVERVGVFELESFYPAKERHELAMKLNNLLASPALKSWTDGEPIELGRMLYGADGKPRLAIFSIAHLDDAKRMFFVSLLLLQVLAWTRSQSGTTSLRALLYMDEIAGYLPPVANPPSKAPLLTLLKQARAFGVGVVLSTQNPVDLDYKALSNAGTWFIGRLQTEQDQARVLDGLAGAAGAGFDRQETARLIAGLRSRRFLMTNVHEDKPVLFESRWTLSYLRGPLTRDQIKLLQPPRSEASGTSMEKSNAAVSIPRSAADSDAVRERPVLSPDLAQYFVPSRAVAGAVAVAVAEYAASCLGLATLSYADAKANFALARSVALAAPISAALGRPDWDAALALDVAAKDLGAAPEASARFGAVPAAAADPANYAAWAKEFKDWLYRNRPLQLRRSPSQGVLSTPGEAENEFRVRLHHSSREKRDEGLEKIRARYAAKIASLEERIRRASMASERQQAQARQQTLQTAVDVGAALLGVLGGRRRSGRAAVSRAASAAKGAGRVMRERQDVRLAAEDELALRSQLEELEKEAAFETELLRGAPDPLTEPLETVELKPRKADIVVKAFGLGWVPRAAERKS